MKLFFFDSLTQVRSNSRLAASILTSSDKVRTCEVLFPRLFSRRPVKHVSKPYLQNPNMQLSGWWEYWGALIKMFSQLNEGFNQGSVADCSPMVSKGLSQTKARTQTRLSCFLQNAPPQQPQNQELHRGWGEAFVCSPRTSGKVCIWLLSASVMSACSQQIIKFVLPVEFPSLDGLSILIRWTCVNCSGDLKAATLKGKNHDRFLVLKVSSVWQLQHQQKKNNTCVLNTNVHNLGNDCSSH